MNPNAAFAEQVQVCAGFGPVDMSAAANTGDWVSLKGYERVTILFFKAAGTAGDDPEITLEEATSVAGGSAQNLAAIDAVWKKQGTLTAVGTYTKVTQTAAATYTDATSAEAAAIWLIDVKAEDLSDGFDCIRASVADVGTNAQLGSMLYLLWPARYGGEGMVSAIAD